jgi:hypothetical protein
LHGARAIFFLHLVDLHAKHGGKYAVVTQWVHSVELFDETITHGSAWGRNHEVIGINTNPHRSPVCAGEDVHVRIGFQWLASELCECIAQFVGPHTAALTKTE